MAYRQPAFMVEHPLAALAVSAITDAQMDNADKRALMDYRQGELAVHNISASGHFTWVDFGAAIAFNRLVMPAGHNLEGETLTISCDDASDFVGAIAQGAPVVPAGVLDHTMSSPATSLRYWGINYSGTGQWEVPEFWFGTYQQLVTAHVAHSFPNEYRYQQTQIEYPGGFAVNQLSVPRRKFALEVRTVAPADADYTLLDLVMTEGRGRPFWYWPPDDTDPGPFLVRLTKATRVQDFSVPASALKYKIKLEMEEETL